MRNQSFSIHDITVNEETKELALEPPLSESPKEKAIPKIELPVVEINAESTKPIETTTVIAADLFGGDLPPVIEKQKPEKKVEKKEEKISSANVQKPIITDLKTAIGINDRFQFANELFEGNMQEFNIAIQQLNTAETLESAMEYIDSLQQLYNWDPKNETVKRLINLVDRRYS
jgi:hypothetical protein